MSASRPCSRSLWLSTLAFAWLATAAPLLAQTSPVGASPAGTYQASPSELTVQVSAWGEDCGPRPQARTDPARPKVDVRLHGTQIALAFPDRTLRSDACWSPNPLVRVASATAAGGRFRLECKTPAGEAKRERGVYTITTGPNVIELLEESDYDWQLKASHCVAKVRFTQRLQREGTAPPESQAEPDEAPAGCTPGPLARLRLRPSSAQIAPGDRLCFTVRAFDAAGCPVPGALAGVKWNLNKRPAATGTLANGCFKAAARSAEAEGRFEISVSHGSLRDQSTVDVVTSDLSDITARRGGGGLTPLDTDSGDDAAAFDFGIQAAVKHSSLGAKLALVALLLALLAGGTAFLLRRWRVAEPSDGEDAPESEEEYERDGAEGEAHEQPSSAHARSAAASGANGEQLICPSCRRGYPAGTEHCPNDGAVPIPYAAFVQRAQAGEVGARTCPACGAQLSQGALFCGECGAKVRS